MGRIKAQNTQPELAVRSILYRAGLRYRLHVKTLPGKPDIVIPSRKSVILVHGCFWHRHKGCKKCYEIKSNLDFWEAKFVANMARDRKNARDLRKSGWRVIVVWECETEQPEKLRSRLQRLFDLPPKCQVK